MSYENVKFTADLNQFAADLQSEWEDYTDTRFDRIDDSIRNFLRYESDFQDSSDVEDKIMSYLDDHVSEHHGLGSSERLTSDDVEYIADCTLISSLLDLKNNPSLAVALRQALVFLLSPPAPPSPSPSLAGRTDAEVQAKYEAFYGEGSAHA
jgi:hypothetical protein